VIKIEPGEARNRLELASTQEMPSLTPAEPRGDES
jgi:hypothetical protein